MILFEQIEIVFVRMNGLAKNSSSYGANSSQANPSKFHSENGDVTLHSLGKQWMTGKFL